MKVLSSRMAPRRDLSWDWELAGGREPGNTGGSKKPLASMSEARRWAGGPGVWFWRAEFRRTRLK